MRWSKLIPEDSIKRHRGIMKKGWDKNTFKYIIDVSEIEKQRNDRKKFPDEDNYEFSEGL